MKQSTAATMFRTVRRAMTAQFGSPWRWVIGFARLLRYGAEYRAFRAVNVGTAYELRAGDIFPCLTDRLASTPVDPVYFLQDTWFAGRIAYRRPQCHVDIASSAKSMALVAQFVPVTFVDIRPVELDVPGFTMVRGTIEHLPFADHSVSSLSSLCVIEHIGLGRYGDVVDPAGSEKAAAELLRILAPGGDLYLSVPVDERCRIYFNAHRAFTRAYLLTLFPGLDLIQERYIYGRQLCEAYDPARGFGTGLYHLRRR